MAASCPFSAHTVPACSGRARSPAVACEASSFSDLPQAVAFSCFVLTVTRGAGESPHGLALASPPQALGTRLCKTSAPASASLSRLVMPGRPLLACCPTHAPWPSCALGFPFRAGGL